MRRFILALFLALIFPALALASSAAVSVTDITREQASRAITITWTGTPSFTTVGTNVTLPNGNVVPLSVACRGFYIIAAETQPSGSAAPTAYAATFTDQYGLDFFGGKITAMSTTTTALTNLQNNVPLNGSYTFALTGNSNSSGGGTMILYLLWAGQTQQSAP